MNVMLASGGYPWTIIRLKRRKQYMAALEDASVRGKIESLAKFVKEEMEQHESLYRMQPMFNFSTFSDQK